MSDEEYLEFTTEELDAIREGIAEELFEIKKFALTKTPILKMYQKRIERLEELSEMQQDLFPDEVVEARELPGIQLRNENVKSLFQSYFAAKNELKHRISNTNSLNEMRKLLMSSCSLERLMGKYFSEIDGGEVVVSKEPDPMEINQAVNYLDELNLRLLEDVKNNLNKVPNNLLNEFKRLSLLFNKY